MVLEQQRACAEFMTAGRLLAKPSAKVRRNSFAFIASLPDETKDYLMKLKAATRHHRKVDQDLSSPSPLHFSFRDTGRSQIQKLTDEKQLQQIALNICRLDFNEDEPQSTKRATTKA